MGGQIVNKYIALMEKSSQTEPLQQNRGLTPHREQLKNPLHVSSGIRAKIDIVPLPLLEPY